VQSRSAGEIHPVHPTAVLVILRYSGKHHFAGRYFVEPEVPMTSLLLVVATSSSATADRRWAQIPTPANLPAISRRRQASCYENLPDFSILESENQPKVAGCR